MRQLSNALSLPCNIQHLKQDLVHLKQYYQQYYHNEVFIDIFYDAERFKNVTQLNWNIGLYYWSKTSQNIVKIRPDTCINCLKQSSAKL